MTKKLTTDCEKHGAGVRALPKVRDVIRLPPDEWPADVETLPRVCVQCLAEAMILPIRRAMQGAA